MTMGSNIKLLRTAKGLSHDKLGQMAGTSGQTIELLERRESTRSKYAMGIARAFGLTVEALQEAPLANVEDAHALLAGASPRTRRSEASNTDWPFETITLQDVVGLEVEERRQLEGAIAGAIALLRLPLRVSQTEASASAARLLKMKALAETPVPAAVPQPDQEKTK